MRLSIPTRRSFLRNLAGCGIALAAPRAFAAGTPAGLVLRIGRVNLEIAKNRTIQTIGYNGSVPGPVIRMREGIPLDVELQNETDDPELVHWHGLIGPVEVDGAEEEGSPAVPAHGGLRYRLRPYPSGARFVHSHSMTMGNFNRGTFTGQFGFFYVEPSIDLGLFDREIFLATHEWDPYLTTEEEPDHKDEHANGHGFEVGYRRYTINGKCFGHGEPIRVKEGERVLFHFLNASATENIRLALPGHRFEVIALDGNPVPHPKRVSVLELGTAERIDAVVTMDTPGVWTLGSPHYASRLKGLGVVVEYSNRAGQPRWIAPPQTSWDYTVFGERRTAPQPDAVIPLVFGQMPAGADGFEQWTINGKPDGGPPVTLSRSARYRLVFDNRTGDDHPVHLHRGTFELTDVEGTPTSGVRKDVVMVRAHRKVSVDFTPDVDGLILFHCHQQLHMEHGFKMLFDVA